MKVILYMATSPNGLIAREDGNEDFLSITNWETFIQLAKQTGNFIYGRKTYENVLTWEKRYLQDISSIPKKVVISQNFTGTPREGFILANSPQEAINILQYNGFSEVLLTGGATNNSAFAKEHLIDEVLLNIEPFIIGTGIPVFKQEDFELDLALISSQRLSNGIVQLRYSVKK